MSHYSDIFTFVKQLSDHEKGFEDNLRARYRRFALFSRLSNPFLILVSNPNKEAKFTFVGRRLSQLILGLPAKDIQVLGNQLDYNFCRRNGIPFVSNNEAWPLVGKALPYFGNAPELENILSQFIHKVAKQLSGTLVISNDSLPVERLMIKAARHAGITTVCVQDGLMQHESPSYLCHGKYADYVFVFSNQQREIFVSKGIQPEKLKVMGFHSDYPDPKCFPKIRHGKERKVCILGQPIGLFYPEKVNRYIELVGGIKDVLSSSGFDVAYKTHPGEKRAEYLNVLGDLYKGDLLSSFNEFDVFVSFNSTALLEATFCGRVAVQVIDSAFACDDFEECGFAYSVASNDLTYLRERVGSLTPMSTPQVEQMLKGNVVERFKYALEQI